MTQDATQVSIAFSLCATPRVSARVLEFAAEMCDGTANGCSMGNVVNLNQARKARARAEAAKRGAENRVLFGRTKDERTRTEAERDKIA